MKRWLIAVIWREPGLDWAPGAAVSSAEDHVGKAQVGLDWILAQRRHHPQREFAGVVYVEDLDAHLGEPCIRRDGEDATALWMQRIKEQDQLIAAMAPVVKAAVAWGKKPHLHDDSPESDVTESLAADIELAAALSGDWEEGTDGRWHRKKTTKTNQG